MNNSVAPTIEELIQTTNDPEKRTMLMVLNKMVLSLDANTRMTEANTAMTSAVSERLEEHIEAFQRKVRADDEITNKGKGAWKVLAWIIGIIQMAIVGGLMAARTEAANINSAIVAHGALDAQLRMEMVNIANTSSMRDLELANRMNILDERCKRLEVVRTGK